MIARLINEMAPNVRYLGDTALDGSEFGGRRAREAAVRDGFVALVKPGTRSPENPSGSFNRYTLTPKGLAAVTRTGW